MCHYVYYGTLCWGCLLITNYVQHYFSKIPKIPNPETHLPSRVSDKKHLDLDQISLTRSC